MRHALTRPVARCLACVSLVIALSLASPALLPLHSWAAGPQIAGTVGYYGTYPGTHPIFVSAHLSMGQPPVNACGITTPGGPYAIGGLPAGSYYVSAFLDKNDTGGGPPDPGEPVAWYDADGDGDADSVSVTGGAMVSSIDIALGAICFVRAGASGAGDGSSWEDAFTRVQDALEAARGNPGTNVWVATGVYTPSWPSGRDAYFSLENQAVYGGFDGSEKLREERDWSANPTVLSGDIGTPGVAADNCYHVVVASGATRTTTLDGFTIRGGNADGAGVSSWGGGFYIADASSPTLRHISFQGNRAAYGGGVCSWADMALRDVTFISNTATTHGGGMFSGGGSPSLAWTAFVSNSAATGGGLYLQLGSPYVTNAIFRSNGATQHGGGLYAVDGSLVLANAAFTGNTAGANGGGACLKGGTPALHNTSLFDNRANSGGGLCVWDSASAVYNSILWANKANTGNQVQTNGLCTTTVGYSIVQGGYAGSHVLDLDPCFVNAVGPDGMVGTGDDDLRLRAGSPAIDAGDNTALPVDLADLDGDGNTCEPVPVDLAGNGRRTEAPAVPNTGNGLGMIVDMGAFEYPWQPIQLPLVIR